MLKLGSTDVNKLYLGGTEVKKMYHGSRLVFEPGGGEPEPVAVKGITTNSVQIPTSGVYQDVPFAVPADARVGNVLVFMGQEWTHVFHTDGPTPGPTWTKLTSARDMVVHVHEVAPGDPDTYNFPISGSSAAGRYAWGALALVSGVSMVDVANGYPTGNNWTASSVEGYAGGLLLAYYAGVVVTSINSISPPPGMTEELYMENWDEPNHYGKAYITSEVVVSNGATGTRLPIYTGSLSTYSASIISFRPLVV